jgi:hypothetical protein
MHAALDHGAKMLPLSAVAQRACQVCPTFIDALIMVMLCCRFVFVQSVSSNGRSLLQSLAGAQPLELGALDALKQAREFESVQWDVANEYVSPHVVGLAIRKHGQQEEGSKQMKKAKKRGAKARSV